VKLTTIPRQWTNQVRLDKALPIIRQFVNNYIASGDIVFDPDVEPFGRYNTLEDPINGLHDAMR